jgi:hypothetical protein
MAKAKQVAYLVTDRSPITYNGKVAACGDTVTDLPGESIAWLLADGFITPSGVPNPDSADAPTPVDEVVADQPTTDAEMPADGGSN